jgi:hypothetical protein
MATGNRANQYRIDLWGNLWKSAIAVVLGNFIYFVILSPLLPESARHQGYHSFDLGLVIDFWVCLVIYGLLLMILRKKSQRQAHH